MVLHNLKLAFRNFYKHKNSFFINLTGLTTGLASAILIFLWINDELQMNQFHEKGNRLFQVMEHQEYADNIMTTHSTPGPLAQGLKEEVPEIEYAATMTWISPFTLTVDDHNLKKEGWSVGADFFNLFSFDLLQGDPNTVLNDVNAMVISESTAESLFGTTQEVIGQSVKVNQENIFTITGIFRNIPSNSSTQFDFVTTFEQFSNENEWVTSWHNNGPRTVVTLHEGANADKVSEKIADYVKKKSENSNITLFLKPFADNYLYGEYENGKLVGGRIEYVRLFAIIAIFILIIACINFMNLSTARASLRAREVGVKKAIGAEKITLIRQYLTESTLVAILSLLIAILLVWLFLPQFNHITDKSIQLSLNPKVLFMIVGITLVTGFLAGSYPALYLSSFQAVKVLKGELRGSLGELWARRGLVIFQFTLSIVLIISVIVVFKQLEFTQNKNLGYTKDNLIYFDQVGKLEEDGATFREEAKKLPGIVDVSFIGHNLAGRQNNTSGLDWEGKNPDDRILFENVGVELGLLETINVEFKAGRSFSSEFGSDSSKIIFNEKAIEVMQMEDPIGKKIRLWEEYDMEIIGVVKDFHFQSLHEDIKPLFFRLADYTWISMARIEAGQEQIALKNLKKLYETFNPGFPFDFEFMDQQYAEMYEAEQRVATLSRYFAGFAILISCLGLFGLASFTADRRKKEIGIRKVLGASVQNIIVLLTKDFTRLVGISIILGIPTAFLLSRNWLDRFAYRIDLNIWFFLTAGLLVLLIAWLTVSSQAFRSARTNPKECLRYE